VLVVNSKRENTKSRDSITVPLPLSCVIQPHAVLRCAKPPVLIENILFLYKKVVTSLIIDFPFYCDEIRGLEL